MFIPPEKVVKDVVVNERKLIADFIRMAHYLMSSTRIAEAIEDGSFLEIIGQKKEDEFLESLERKC